MKKDLLEFWATTDEEFLTRCRDSGKAPLPDRVDDLRFRRLPKRASAFGQRLVLPPVCPDWPDWSANSDGPEALNHDRLLNSGIQELLFGDEGIEAALARRCDRDDLAEMIRERALTLAAHLELELPELRWLLLSPIPQPPFEKLGNAIVFHPGGRLSLFREHMPVDQWSDTYAANKRYGWVFCTPGWEAVVFLATELVLFEEFDAQQTERPDIRFRFKAGFEVLALTKHDSGKLDEYKQKLDQAGVYRSARAIRPLLPSEDVISTISTRFRSFDGAGTTSATSWRVGVDTVAAFIRQFPCNLQQLLVDEVLLHIEVLDRAAVVSPIVERLKHLKVESDQCAVLPFSPNSGNFVKMLTKAQGSHQLGDGVVFHDTPLRQLKSIDRRIVLVDDLLASGSQASVQFQAWFGVPRENWLDPEERGVDEEPLEERQRDALKASGVTLLVAKGTDKGCTRIRETAEQLGLNVDLQMTATFADSSSDLTEELRRELATVGTAVLESSRGPNDAERDALGYGGTMGLLVGLFNVPTCCPPALWCPGEYLGEPWVPLFIRRGYQHKAVFT